MVDVINNKIKGTNGNDRAFMYNTVTREVFLFLLSNKKGTASDLLRQSNVNRAYCSLHSTFKKLEEMKLISSKKVTRNKIFELTLDGRAIARRIEEINSIAIKERF
jgi:predicted transcriptional regulator